MVTRQTFERVAAAVKSQLENTHSPGEIVVVNNLANVIADEFETLNPAFDRKRFLKACGFSV